MASRIFSYIVVLLVADIIVVVVIVLPLIVLNAVPSDVGPLLLPMEYLFCWRLRNHGSKRDHTISLGTQNCKPYENNMDNATIILTASANLQM